MKKPLAVLILLSCPLMAQADYAGGTINRIRIEDNGMTYFGMTN